MLYALCFVLETYLCQAANINLKRYKPETTETCNLGTTHYRLQTTNYHLTSQVSSLKSNLTQTNPQSIPLTNSSQNFHRSV